MSLITNDENINNMIEYCKAYYQLVFHIETKEINIYFSNDIIADYNKFSLHKRNDFDNKPNGTYIYPNNSSDQHTILINHQMYKLDRSSSVATILHELTHFADYNIFNTECCGGTWKDIIEHPLFESMYYWSEYHARIIEIVHMHIITSKVNKTYPYDINKLKVEMIDWHLPRYNKELITHIKNDTFVYRYLFDYCGRLYVCNLYNNHDIPLQELVDKHVLYYFPNIEKLYTYLKDMQTYRIASPKFSSINSVMKDVLKFYEFQFRQER